LFCIFNFLFFKDSDASVLEEEEDSVIELDDKDDDDSDYDEDSGPSNRSEQANNSKKEDHVVGFAWHSQFSLNLIIFAS